MATVKISELESASSVTSSNVLAIVQNGETKKVTVNTLLSDIYSTNELKTNKVWIDGKPIYRKVIDFGALPNAESKKVNHGISNLESVVNYCGYATDGTNTIPLPYTYPNSNYISYYVSLGTVTSTQVEIVTGTNRSDYSGYIILEYTKTTD